MKSEGAACASDEFLMDAFYRLSVCPVLVRFVIIEELCPVGFGGRMVKYLRALVFGLYVSGGGVWAANRGHDGGEVPPGWKWPAGGLAVH